VGNGGTAADNQPAATEHAPRSLDATPPARQLWGLQGKANAYLTAELVTRSATHVDACVLAVVTQRVLT
jgi:hypothetical protein